MAHDITIPHDMHAGARKAAKGCLGAFWTSVFRDQGLLDALMAARSLDAAQTHVSAMEALGLRDHRTSPAYHREHWHPLFVRLSQRNMGRGLTVGMDSAVIGPQTGADTPYSPGEEFVVGWNDSDETEVKSKVNTYPFSSFGGCRLVRVGTCVCDSVSEPRHILTQGRDFDIDGDVIIIRKEQDPFDAGGYRIVDSGDDRVAVMWVCDGEYDTGNVADFLSYPMGFDVESSEESRRLMSAYWDAVVFGLTPRHLNTMLGALYGVPTSVSDETVESVTGDGDFTVVVTDARVYRIETSRLARDRHGELVIRAGLRLSEGDFLTGEITVLQGFSEDEFGKLVDAGVFTPEPTEASPSPVPTIELPPGSVLGVDVPVTVEGIDSVRESGDWFKLSADDDASSLFWRAVGALSDGRELSNLLDRLFPGPGPCTVNPLKTVGYAALANTVIVFTERPLVDTQYAGQLLQAVRDLMPGYASMLTVRATVTAI